MKVLLVEDHAELRQQLQRTLHAIPGVQVVQSCSTSKEAIQWLDRHPELWDLAVVDLFLQQGNGFDVLRRCKHRGARQKVVVLSNYVRDPTREYVWQAGGDALFDKSHDLDALIGFCVSHAQSCRQDTNAVR